MADVAFTWQNVKIRENNDSLVPAGPFSKYPEFGGFPAMYFGANARSPYGFKEINGALATQFIRKNAAEALRAAQHCLPPRMIFHLFEGYRTDEVHEALHARLLRYYRANSGGMQLRIHPLSDDPSHPFPYSTGGVISLALAEFPSMIRWKEFQLLTKVVKHIHGLDSVPWQFQVFCHLRIWKLVQHYSKILPMGSGFDQFIPVTEYDFSGITKEMMDRRILLHNSLGENFSQSQERWWEWHIEDQMDAYARGKITAHYGKAQFLGTHERWETMMRWTYIQLLEADIRSRFFGGNLRISKDVWPLFPFPPREKFIACIQRMSKLSYARVNPFFSNNPPASKIEI